MSSARVVLFRHGNMMKVVLCAFVLTVDAATTTTTVPASTAPSGFAEFKDKKCTASQSKIELGGKMRDDTIMFEKSVDYDKAVKACAFECLRIRGCGGFQISRTGSLKGRCLAYPGNCKMGDQSGSSWFGVVINGTAGAVDPAGKLTSCNMNVPGYAGATAQAGYCPYPTFDAQTAYDKEAFTTGKGTVATCADACNADPQCGGFNFAVAGILKGRCVKKGTGGRLLTGRADSVMYEKIHVAAATTLATGKAGDAVRGTGALAVAVAALVSTVVQQM